MFIEAVVAQGHKVVTLTRRLWARSPPEIIIFNCSLWHQGKSPVLSSTQDAMPQKNWREVGNGVFYHYVPSAYFAVCNMRNTA